MAGSASTNHSHVTGTHSGVQPGVPRPHERGLGVVLIDQTPLFRDGMANLVNHAPGLRWLGATHNVHTALRLIERLNPDIALVDAGLDPRRQLTKLLATSGKHLTIVSLVRDPHRAAAYLSEGANGMVLRSAEPTQIMETIRRAHIERRYVEPTLAALAQGTDDRTPGARQPLSRREHQVLQLIADGLENQAIAKTLFVSVETVRTHVKSILRKLHARDRAHAVAIAFRLAVLTIQPDGPAPTAASARPVNGAQRDVPLPKQTRPLRTARA